MHVEVVFALPDNQHLVHVELPENATVETALNAVARYTPFQALNLEEATVGIFGRIAHRNQKLQAGDRVEIYRPLMLDPKEARRRRAQSS